MSNKSHRNLVVTISGQHGSGRSTQAKTLADIFNLKHISTGLIFREIAGRKGLDIEEMSRLAEEKDEFDKFLDLRAKEESRRGGVIIDATLSGWVAESPDLRIYLQAPLEVRVLRIAKRERRAYEEIYRETTFREKSEQERFLRYYNIDILDLSIYDLVLNTGLYDIEATSRILKMIVEEYISSRGVHCRE